MATILSIQKDFLLPGEEDYREAARYLGYSRISVPDEQIQNLIRECCQKMYAVISPKAVFDSFALKVCPSMSAPAENACAAENADSTENASTTLNSGEAHAMSAPAENAGSTENACAATGSCPDTNSGSAQKLAENPAQKSLISFSDVNFYSHSLGINLRDCTTVFLMAATIGPQVDALIRKTQITDTVKASIFQAAGAMFIEKAVDYVNEEIKKAAATQNKSCKPRFSPGYGDVSLELQKDFFRLLPCAKIGLSLMDTLIMAPEKSVTAFVGAF